MIERDALSDWHFRCKEKIVSDDTRDRWSLLYHFLFSRENEELKAKTCNGKPGLKPIATLVAY